MRKWLVRGLVYLLLGGLAAGGGLYALGTNPAAVRQLVVAGLADRFQHVAVSVDHARLRLLGGILVSELRLARNDGLDQRDFLYAPDVIFYHDKEHLLEGKLLVRKIELSRPQFRIVRERSGQLNLSDILSPPDLSERLPAVVLHQGTLVYEDRAAGPGALLEIRNVQLTLVNDPLPTLQVEGAGEIDLLGRVTFRATVHRASMSATVQLDLPDVPVGSDLMERAGRLCPDLAAHVAALTGRAEVHAHLQVRSDQVGHRVTARLRDGRWCHPRLPAPLEKIDARVTCVDGRVSTATLTAASGPARLKVRLADLRLPAPGGPPPDLDDLVAEMDLAVSNLNVTDAVLKRLPENLRFLEGDFSPAGPISFSYRYRKAGPGPLVKEWLVEPQGMTGSYDKFRYPLNDVRGTIRLDTSGAPLRDITLDLTGKAGDRPAALHGHIRGPKKTSEVVLDITAQDIPLDDRIYQALPLNARKVADQFLPEDRYALAVRPIGRGDVIAAVRRRQGEEEFERRYTVTFKDGRARYRHFPYTVEQVSGVLDLLPDHWECRGFHGLHDGGEIHVEGRSFRLPGPGGAPLRDRIRVAIQGRGIPMDAEFEHALAPGGGEERKGLQRAWRTLKLAGRLNFSADVIDTPGQPQDIDVTVGVQGCTMKPTFFDYALEEVSGSVRYARGRVHLRGLKARHGPAELGLATGLIQLAPEGGFTAWLEGIDGKHLPPDADLMHALPEGLRRGIVPLALREQVELRDTQLTIVTSPSSLTPKVWWEGGVHFDHAVFRAGVEVGDAAGVFFCRGHFDGRRLRGVWGDVWLDRASVLGQPLTKVHGRMEILPDTPEVIRFRDLKADLFGGSVGGEARLELAPVFRYELTLEALGVQLDQFGRHNLGAAARSAQLQGPARAAVYVYGEGADLSGLKGNGRVDVPQGKMGQLPVLLDLVKAFGLRVPDRTAFEEAHLIFGLEGPRVLVQQLDLYGNAISLRGQGGCDVTGSNLELDFTATMGRFTQLLPSAIDAIPQTISQQLLKIKMRGKLGKDSKLTFDKELVPGVMEPLRWAFGS
jgi:hypothetical protein